MNFKYNHTFILCSSIFAFASCSQDPGLDSLGLSSCPLNQKVSVMSVSYNQAQNVYSIFHTTAPGLEKLKNPLQLKDLQMIQAQNASETESIASLKFLSQSSSCAPVLEMTKNFKIELINAPNHAQNGNGSGSSSSYWAPFLMGAMASHMISSALTPAYYLPPPASASAPGGVVTGGVSAQNPQDLNKKYENTYGQQRKNGFFSKKSVSASADSGEPKKGGFFSRKSDPSSHNSSRSSGGFFKKR